MADLKISQFAVGGTVQTTDEIATNRAGINTKVLVGSAAAADIGGGIGDIPAFQDDGLGGAQYPSGDGSLITGISVNATSVPFTPTGSIITGTEVQDAIDQLESYVENLDAGQVSYSGTLMATDVEAGLNELDSIKLENITGLITAGTDIAITGAGTSGSPYSIAYNGSGAIVTPWVAYTPTFTALGTVTGVNIYSRRVGANLEIRGYATSGTATGSEGRVTLGFNGTNGGITSTSAMGSGTNLCGMVALSAVGAFNIYALIEPSTAYITFGLQNAAAAALSKATGSSGIGNTIRFSINASIPIQGW